MGWGEPAREEAGKGWAGEAEEKWFLSHSGLSGMKRAVRCWVALPLCWGRLAWFLGFEVRLGASDRALSLSMSPSLLETSRFW